MTPEEFSRTYLPLADGLYQTALDLLGSHEEAEDTVQDCFVKLWLARNRLSAVRDPRAWTHILVRNLCIDRLRTRKGIHEEPIPSDLPLEPEPESDFPERMARVLRAIGTLPGKDRELLHLRLLEGLSYEEIARRKGLSEVALRVAFHRLKQKIKRSL